MRDIKEKEPLTHQPFKGLIHPAFAPPEQTGGQTRDNRSDGRNRPRKHPHLKEANTMGTEAQASQIASTVEDNGGSTVAEQRKAAEKAARAPATGAVDPGLGRVLDMLGVSIQQNSQILGQNAQLIGALVTRDQENALKQQMLLQTASEKLEKFSALGDVADGVASEIKKARKGKKSLFKRTKWDKAEDAAYQAGAVAVGSAVGLGLVAFARYGAKTMFGGA
jgi:hypothetical protein